MISVDRNKIGLFENKFGMKIKLEELPGVFFQFCYLACARYKRRMFLNDF